MQAKKKGKNSMVGKFFHSINKDNKIEWQGYIMAEPKKGFYFIKLFDWIMGQEYNQQIVSFEEMKNWLFYDDNESMRYSYEYGATRSHKTEYQDLKNNV